MLPHHPRKRCRSSGFLRLYSDHRAGALVARFLSQKLPDAVGPRYSDLSRRAYLGPLRGPIIAPAASFFLSQNRLSLRAQRSNDSRLTTNL